MKFFSCTEKQSHKTSVSGRVSSADTAYLVGPGCLRLRGRVPWWRPVNGTAIRLQPKLLKQIVFLGLADVTGATFELLWRNQISVVFLAPDQDKVLGRVDPNVSSARLVRLQWQAAQKPKFQLKMARQIIDAKFDTAQTAARYYQQQGKGSGSGNLIKFIKKSRSSLNKQNSISAILGCEGAVAAKWWKFFATLVPNQFKFRERKSFPSPDPVNAVLSLGYTLLTTRATRILNVVELDSQVGFLHALRAGRHSLACDLIEPFRIPVVDRLIVSMLTQRKIQAADFQPGQKHPCELKKESLKIFVAEFENKIRSGNPSSIQQIQSLAKQWCVAIRSETSSSRKA